MIFSTNIHKFQDQIYDWVTYLTWFLYIIVAFGLSAKAPQYLDNLQNYIKVYVSLFLIYRFNPFRHVKFTELDGKIAFSAGVFLLGTTAIDGILRAYLSNIKL